MYKHPSITYDRICDAAQESLYGTEGPGFCLDCGADAYGCEPDAKNYKCEECGAMSVYGAELVLVMFA